jgi:hypothetical protein
MSTETKMLHITKDAGSSKLSSAITTATTTSLHEDTTLSGEGWYYWFAELRNLDFASGDETYKVTMSLYDTSASAYVVKSTEQIFEGDCETDNDSDKYAIIKRMIYIDTDEYSKAKISIVTTGTSPNVDKNSFGGFTG